MHRTFLTALIFAVLCADPLSAQQVPGSTIAGHVFCADTNAPARFAKVTLKSVAPDHAVENWVNHQWPQDSKDGQPVKPISDEERRARAVQTRHMNSAADIRNSVTVGLDGLFIFTGVKPGKYYVHAVLAGYVDPVVQLSDADFASNDPAIRSLIARIPTITVSGTDTGRLDLRLERGAAASGRLLFEDGSPASGWTVSALRPSAEIAQADIESISFSGILGYGPPIIRTDDQGRFRISGLPAGDYMLRATLDTGDFGINQVENDQIFTVYTGDTFSHAKAKTIHVSSGEENSSADINIPVHTMHSISGHVDGKSDSHTVNEGYVILTAPDDSAVHISANVQSDGSFRFDYLPEGAYILNITNAVESRRTNEPPERNHAEPGTIFVQKEDAHMEVVHHFGPASLSVTLGDADIDSVHLTVPDAPAK